VERRGEQRLPVNGQPVEGAGHADVRQMGGLGCQRERIDQDKAR
jgi:hypothetical protein